MTGGGSGCVAAEEVGGGSNTIAQCKGGFAVTHPHFLSARPGPAANCQSLRERPDAGGVRCVLCSAVQCSVIDNQDVW